MLTQSKSFVWFKLSTLIGRDIGNWAPMHAADPIPHPWYVYQWYGELETILRNGTPLIGVVGTALAKVRFESLDQLRFSVIISAGIGQGPTGLEIDLRKD